MPDAGTREPLSVNPFAAMVGERTNEGRFQLWLLAPLRGRGLFLQKLRIEPRPSLLRALTEFLGGRAKVTELGDPDVEALVQMGILMRPSEIPQRAELCCFLDEQPSPLVPYRASLGSDVDNPDNWILHPCARVLLGKRRILARADSLPPCTPTSETPLLFLEDHATQIPMFYWLREPFTHLLPALLAHEGHMFAPAVRQVFHDAGILVSKDALEKGRHQWSEQFDAARKSFRRNGYAVVRDALHPFQVGALRKYFRDLIGEGYVAFDEDQVPLRYLGPKEQVTHFYHAKFAPFVARVVGEPVRPSLCYLASYQAGSILQKHLDRQEAEWSVSVAIDYVPAGETAEQDRKHAWPLAFERGWFTKREHEVHLAMGDCAIHHGRRLPHYRPALPEGQSATLMFLHFVPADFEGARH